MDKNQVVKSNQVVEASYQLSAVEQRIILSAISLIPKNQLVTDDKLYPVGVSDLHHLGVHEKTAYRDLREGINRLYERSININIDGKSIKIRWVQEIQFLDNSSSIGIRFSKPILPFISNLSREFTKYALSDIAGMSSGYAIRIYELLTQYKSIGKREIAVEDIRLMLDLGKKYPLFADFKKRVIEIAIEQINLYSPLDVAYQQKKTGRKVTYITFNFKEKKKHIQSIPLRIHSSEFNLTEAQLDYFSYKLCKMNALSVLAEGNESYESLAIKIKKLLQDKEKKHQFVPYLVELGFKFNA